MNGRIKVEGFKVDAIDVDAINPPDEPVQDPEKVKPKSTIDTIRHLEVPAGDLEKDFVDSARPARNGESQGKGDEAEPGLDVPYRVP